MKRRQLLTVILVFLLGVTLQSCSFLMDEFFTLGKANPDLERMAERHAGH